MPHQPQPDMPVHSPQSAALQVDPPPHSLDSQLQSAQEPVSGPDEFPTSQVPVSPHQPHG